MPVERRDRVTGVLVAVIATALMWMGYSYVDMLLKERFFDSMAFLTAAISLRLFTLTFVPVVSYFCARYGLQLKPSIRFVGRCFIYWGGGLAVAFGIAWVVDHELGLGDGWLYLANYLPLIVAMLIGLRCGLRALCDEQAVRASGLRTSA